MKKHPIATIVNFCTNESRFIAPCLKEVSRFSKQVIVPVCDHFFDGTPEDLSLLDQICSAFPDCLFVQYPFIPDKIPRSVFKKIKPAHFWHSVSRFVGFSFLDDAIETVLFLDADEIPEADRMQEWLDCSDYHQHTALKMANYWYFRESRFQAKTWEDTVVLANRKALKMELLLHQDERNAIYNFLPHPKKSMVTGTDRTPLFHHYSWVRTEAEMLKKVKSWGHRDDRDWEPLVRAEFAKNFSGVDFVHGYDFKTIEAVHRIDLEPVSFTKRGKGRKKILLPADLLRLLKGSLDTKFQTLCSNVLAALRFKKF